MPSKIQKIISSIILGLMALLYILLGIVVLITVQGILGVVFIFAGIIAVSAIVGINNKNKVLLWLGTLALIQILDGITSLVNRYLFSENVSIAGPMFISILYILPVMVMYRIVKEKGGVRGK